VTPGPNRNPGAPMAAKGLVTVFHFRGEREADIARTMEPRANSPARRIQAIAHHAYGVHSGLFSGPLIGPS